MKKFDFRVVVLVLLGGVFLGGCSHKIFRTKPTTYVNIHPKNVKNISEYSKSLLKFHCIKADENVTTADTIGKCEDYTIVDISKLSTIHINAKDDKVELRVMANDLFHIADANCKKFTDKFYYHTLIDNTASQSIGLNIFGMSIGVDLSDMVKLSHTQFNMLNDNLFKNLKDREVLKKSIKNNITKVNTYTNEALLVDIIAYDNTCSLFRVEKSEEGK